MKFGFVAALVNRIKDNIPLGLVSLCTILKGNDIPCEIVDFFDLNKRLIISDNDFNETLMKPHKQR